MRFHLILAAALAASSAHANDFAPAVNAGFTDTESRDWSGLYAGAQLGLGQIRFSDSESKDKADIYGYGLHVGYMYDFGSVVAGGELGYNRLSFKDTNGRANNGLLRLKGGYDLGHYMPYITVGIGHLSGGNSGFSEVGPAFGIGASFKTAKNITVSAEYTQQKVTHDFIVGTVVNDGTGSLETNPVDLRTGLFQTKVSFQF